MTASSSYVLRPQQLTQTFARSQSRSFTLEWISPVFLLYMTLRTSRDPNKTFSQVTDPPHWQKLRNVYYLFKSAKAGEWWKWNNFVKNNFVLIFFKEELKKIKMLLKGGVATPSTPPLDPPLNSLSLEVFTYEHGVSCAPWFGWRWRWLCWVVLAWKPLQTCESLWHYEQYHWPMNHQRMNESLVALYEHFSALTLDYLRWKRNLAFQLFGFPVQAKFLWLHLRGYLCTQRDEAFCHSKQKQKVLFLNGQGLSFSEVVSLFVWRCDLLS